MKDFLFYFYIGFVFLGVFLIFYRIYKYGVIGYIEKRTERRRKRVDTLNNIFRDTY
jgi:hypothetical protein